MLSNTLNQSGKPAAPVFNKVGENLYRLDSSGTYYGLLKRAGKQFRRSLKTTDRKLAERRLAELRQQIGNLSLTEDANLSFEDVARRWQDTPSHALKESSVKRRATCIKNRAPYFKGVTIRNATARHCERWLTESGRDIAPQTFAHELNAMRGVFDYALRQGLVFTNPARDIQCRRITQANRRGNVLRRPANGLASRVSRTTISTTSSQRPVLRRAWIFRPSAGGLDTKTAARWQ